MPLMNRYRVAALILVLGGTLLLALIGKQHTLILANEAYEAAGTRLDAYETAVVKNPNPDEDDLEIYEGESDSLQVVGPFFTVHVEIPAAEGQGALSAAKKLYLGYADTITVNIPQMMHENNTRGE